MRYPFRVEVVALIAGACLLAACTGPQQEVDPNTGAPVDPMKASVSRENVSWMLPEAKTDDLLYVAVSQGTVSAFSFPAGKLVGKLTGFGSPFGLCSDANGDIFVVDAKVGDIIEYSHGGMKPIATLTGDAPSGCYIDPNSGNLAVAGGGNEAVLAIYQNASGSPAVYTNPHMSGLSFCTFDDAGDVFAEGGFANDRARGWLVELPKGGNSLTMLNQGFQFTAGGGIQWDGRYLALEDVQGSGRARRRPIAIDQVEISGSTATEVGRIELNTGKHPQNPGLGTEFWIHGGTITSPETKNHGVGSWRYPAAGHELPVHRFQVGGGPVGVTVSLATR